MTTSFGTLTSCFWELTRRCEHLCLHCRARGAIQDRDELSLDQSLRIAQQLVALGTRRVVLTGGEPTLYRGWERIARELTKGGVAVRLFVSGVPFDEQTLEVARGADITELAVSIDGPTPIHDKIRPLKRSMHESSFARAHHMAALAKENGLKVRIVTALNKINIDHLEEIYHIARELEVDHWQVHLCQATGASQGNLAQLLLKPSDLRKIIAVLLLAAREKRLIAPLHCTVGYYSVEEPVLRGREMRARPVWLGCMAGRRTLAIGPDGTVKGCTTLPDEFITASLKDRALADIWKDDTCFPYSRAWSEKILAGACRRCPMGQICRAGCPAVAYSTTGSIGINPFCLRHLK